MTQAELAARIGEHQTVVSKCEGGVRRVDVIELRRWTQALGIGLIEFVKVLEHRLERSRLPGPLRKKLAGARKQVSTKKQGLVRGGSTAKRGR
jgi:hypothetical protein